MKKKRKNKGFTLAELLIVVAIIAVLIVIAIPILTKHLSKAEIATTEANIRAAKAAAVADYMMYAKNDAIEETEDENLLTWLNNKFSFTLEAYAAEFASLYGQDSTEYVFYKYKGGKLLHKDQVDPNVSSVGGNPNKYDTIAVRINKQNGVVETKPYIKISGSTKSVEADDFAVGDSIIGGPHDPGWSGSGSWPEPSSGSWPEPGSGSWPGSSEPGYVHWWLDNSGGTPPLSQMAPSEVRTTVQGVYSYQFSFNSSFRYIECDGIVVDMNVIHNSFPEAWGVWVMYEDTIPDGYVDVLVLPTQHGRSRERIHIYNDGTYEVYGVTED